MADGSLTLVTADWDGADLDDVCAAFINGWGAVGRVAWLVRCWKRRLGAEATGAELAVDKKIANRVGATALAQVRRWGGPDESWGDLGEGFYGEADPAERRAAAIMDWWSWVPAQLLQSSDDRQALLEWCAHNRVYGPVVKRGMWAARDAEKDLARVCRYMTEQADTVGVSAADAAAALVTLSERNAARKGSLAI